MNKTRILIIYSKMVVGGSTTSLLSILNGFNYSKYEVTLLLLDDTGDLQHLINQNVIVIKAKKPSTLGRLLNPSSWIPFIIAEVESRKKKNRLIKAQINSSNLALSMSALKTTYDVAISFLEFWPQRYLACKVRANKKISWIHIDPYEAGLNAKYSRKFLEKVDSIILVSNSCKENFDKMFPQLADRSQVVENILDAEIIRSMSKEPLENNIISNKIRLVTVCRINLASKGLDRVVLALKKIKDEGVDVESKIDWFIIGDGPDSFQFSKLVKDSGLSNIHMMGKQLNPYKYETKMHYFLLPSRYEGKPMAVTEAQMLGLVPIVCNYSSAKEQIENGKDGIIVNNDDESIMAPLRQLVEGSIPYNEFRNKILATNYSNTYIIEKIYDLFL